MTVSVSRSPEEPSPAGVVPAGRTLGVLRSPRNKDAVKLQWGEWSMFSSHFFKMDLGNVQLPNLEVLRDLQKPEGLFHSRKMKCTPLRFCH